MSGSGQVITAGQCKHQVNTSNAGSTVNTLDKNKQQVNIFDKPVTDKCGDRKHQENTQVSSHFEGNAATEKTALIVNSKTKTKTKKTL